MNLVQDSMAATGAKSESELNPECATGTDPGQVFAATTTKEELGTEHVKCTAENVSFCKFLSTADNVLFIIVMR